MRINHNISALNTYRQLTANNSATSSSLQKLSSGLRINSAADDAAGLAISEKMRGQIRGLDQATSNANDGISLIQTAEGALNETHSILQRMRELAVQSANDTNTDADRAEIQKEIEQLTSEITRISTDTQFNTKNLLDGSMAATAETEAGKNVKASVAAGATLESGEYTVKLDGYVAGKEAVAASKVTASVAPADLATARTAAGGAGASKTYTYDAATGKWDDGAAQFDTAAMKGTNGITVGGEAQEDAKITLNGGTAAAIGQTTLTINTLGGAGDKLEIAGKTFTFYANAAAIASANGGEGDAYGIAVDTANSADLQAAAIRTALGTTADTKLEGVTVSGAGAAITLTQNVAGIGNVSEGSVKVNAGGLAAAASATTVGAAEVAASVTVTQSAAVEAKDAQYKATITTGTGADMVEVSNASFDYEFDDAFTAAMGSAGFKVTVDASNALVFHIGANSGQNTTLNMNNMNAESLGIDKLDLTSQKGADAAITTIDKAITTVSAQRAALGAMQNRLEHTINNLSTTSENLTASESQIRDVDMAKEMMEYTKNNILSQAAQSMLAQANQQPQNVLQLLQ